MSSKKVPIEDVVLHERCQARAEIRHEAIDEYAEAIKAGVELPPLRVARVSGVLHLIDGFHRVGAYRKAGVSFVRVEIVDAESLDQAEWLAVAANQSHGLRRSNADKRKAVRMALASAIGSEQSSVVIAEHVGVSDAFVSSIRREMEAVRQVQTVRTSNDSGDQVQTVATSTAPGGQVQTVRTSEAPAEQAARRIGKDGKSYPAAKPKREAKPEPLKAPEPEFVPPPVKVRPVDERTTAEPMPATGPLLSRAADILRAARLEAAKVLGEGAGRYLPAVKAAEVALRCDVPVVCDACGGKGTKCNPCQRRGWVLTGQLGGVPRG